MNHSRWYAAAAAAALAMAPAAFAADAAPAAPKSPPNNFTADEQTPASMPKPKPAFPGQTERRYANPRPHSPFRR